MSEVTQLASAMLVIVFATVMLVAGQFVHREQGKQVGKVSDRARRANRFYSPLTILPQIETDRSSGRRVNNIAVRSSRHQAILHLAARGQFVSQP